MIIFNVEKFLTPPLHIGAVQGSGGSNPKYLDLVSKIICFMQNPNRVILFSRRHQIKDRLKYFGTILENKYFIDYLYERIIVTNFIYKYLSKFLYWFDQNVVDGVVQMVDLFSKKIAYQFGRLQTGQLQNYALAITIGVVLIFIFYGVNNKIWNLVNLSI